MKKTRSSAEIFESGQEEEDFLSVASSNGNLLDLPSLTLDWDGPALPQPEMCRKLDTTELLAMKLSNLQLWNTLAYSEPTFSLEYSPADPCSTVPSYQAHIYADSKGNPLLDPSRLKFVREIDICREVLFMISGNPADLFANTDGAFSFNRKFSLRHLTNESLLGILTEFLAFGNSLQLLRGTVDELIVSNYKFQRIFAHTILDYLLKIEEVIGKLHAKFRPDSPDVILSLMALWKEIRPHAEKLLAVQGQLVQMKSMEFHVIMNTLSSRLELDNFFKNSGSLLETLFHRLLVHLHQEIETHLCHSKPLEFQLPDFLKDLETDINLSMKAISNMPYQKRTLSISNIDAIKVNDLRTCYSLFSERISQEQLRYCLNEHKVSLRLNNVWSLLLWQDGYLMNDFVEYLHEMNVPSTISPQVQRRLDTMIREDLSLNLLSINLKIVQSSWLSVTASSSDEYTLNEVLSERNLKGYSEIFELILNLKLAVCKVSRNRSRDFKQSITSFSILRFLLGLETYLLTMVIGVELSKNSLLEVVTWKEFLTVHGKMLHVIESRSMVKSNAGPLMASIKKIVKVCLSSNELDESVFDSEKKFIGNSLDAMIKASPAISLQLESLKLLLS